MIDSETEGAQPLLYPEDWHCVRGDLYALHAGNAYEHGRLPPHHIESPPAGEITQTGRQIIDGDFLRHMEYEQYVTALKVRDLVFHVRDHPWAPPDLGTIDLSGGDDATMTTPPDETHVTKKIKKKTKKEMKPQGTYRGGVQRQRKYKQPRLELSDWLSTQPARPPDTTMDAVINEPVYVSADPIGNEGAQCMRCGKANVGRLGRPRRCQHPDGCDAHMHDWCSGLHTERGYCPDVWLCPTHTAGYSTMGLPCHLTTDRDGYYEYCGTCGGQGSCERHFSVLRAVLYTAFFDDEKSPLFMKKAVLLIVLSIIYIQYYC
jgi:hypothetical protein